MNKKFWTIRKATNSSSIFPTKEEAINAASESLNKNLKVKYYILEVVGVVEAVKNPTNFEEIK